MNFEEKKENKDQLLFRVSQEKDKLTLRKHQIFDKLFTKRKLLSNKEEQNHNKYMINISSVSTNKEIIENPELYIKTKFDIKNWFSYLFSKNYNQIKQALFLIELYIKLQINEIPAEKQALSRNNYELINCLCQYLNHDDKQISFYSCIIISNLMFFPYHIQKLIYTEKNLNEILLFINKNDFEFAYEIIVLMINCCSDSGVTKYFIENKIMEKIIFFITKDINKLKPNYYIYLIRLLCQIIKLFEVEEYSFTQIKNWFIPLLPFIKDTLKNNHVENPWFIKEESKYYIKILRFYCIMSGQDIQIIYNIIKDGFAQTLIEFYYILNEENKCLMMENFIDLLSKDDSINQIFIEEGILGLLINEINRIEYKNNKLLNSIFMVCSNIACGSVGQIEQLFINGILHKAIDISYYYISQNILDSETKKVIYNCIYTLNEAILGGSKNVKVEIIIYQEYLIISLYYLILKNICDIEASPKFLGKIGDSINKLIITSESDLEKTIVDKLRNKFIMVGMEELINNIIYNYNNDNKIHYNYGMILQFIQEQEN